MPIPGKNLLKASLLLVIFALTSTTGAQTGMTQKQAWALIDKVDRLHYNLQNSGATFLNFEFDYSGLKEFLTKNVDTKTGESVQPVKIEWKKKYGSNVVYRTNLSSRLKQPAILILKEFKDIFLQKTLRQSLVGYTVGARKIKNEYHVRAIVLKKSGKPKPFVRVDIVIDAAYRVKRMAFVNKDGAQLTQEWSLKKLAGKYYPTKVTISSKLAKLVLLRQVLYTYRKINGFYFPDQVTIKTRTAQTKTKTETIKFKNVVLK